MKRTSTNASHGRVLFLDMVRRVTLGALIWNIWWLKTMTGASNDHTDCAHPVRCMTDECVGDIFRVCKAVCKGGSACEGAQFGGQHGWAGSSFATCISDADDDQVCNNAKVRYKSKLDCTGKSGCNSVQLEGDSQMDCSLKRGGCDSIKLTDSVLNCSGESGCGSIKSERSAITCDNRCCGLVQDSVPSEFLTSAVICYSKDSCRGATFGACSCCNGPGCPSNAPSCASDTFCDMIVDTISCKEYGNPICGGKRDDLISVFESAGEWTDDHDGSEQQDNPDQAGNGNDDNQTNDDFLPDDEDDDPDDQDVDEMSNDGEDKDGLGAENKEEKNDGGSRPAWVLTVEILGVIGIVLGVYGIWKKKIDRWLRKMCIRMIDALIEVKQWLASSEGRDAPY